MADHRRVGSIGDTLRQVRSGDEEARRLTTSALQSGGSMVFASMQPRQSNSESAGIESLLNLVHFEPELPRKIGTSIVSGFAGSSDPARGSPSPSQGQGQPTAEDAQRAVAVLQRFLQTSGGFLPGGNNAPGSYSSPRTASVDARAAAAGPKRRQTVMMRSASEPWSVSTAFSSADPNSIAAKIAHRRSTIMEEGPAGQYRGPARASVFGSMFPAGGGRRARVESVAPAPADKSPALEDLALRRPSEQSKGTPKQDSFSDTDAARQGRAMDSSTRVVRFKPKDTGDGVSKADVADSTGNDASPNSADRRDKAKHELQSLLATHPAVAVLDVTYVVATITLWVVCVSAVGSPTAQPGVDSPHFGVSVACQVVSLLWMVSRFFIQSRQGEWEILDQLPDIRRHYRETWLAFDAFCCLPIELILVGWATEFYFWLQLRQLVRIVRIANLTRSGNPLVDNRMWLLLVSFVLFVVFVVHSAATAFWALEEGSPQNPRLGYWDAFYWASMTMTSVGYGDVLPGVADSHRVFASFIMFLGIAMVSSFTAFATSFLTSTDALVEEMKEKKQMLASMIDHYRIPWDVQVELIGLLPTALDAENEKKFTTLIQNMPAFMVEKIEGYTRAKALSTSIPLFSELPLEVVLELTAKLAHRFCQANQPIIMAGEEGFEMFFLVRGVADVVIPIPNNEELLVAVLRSGSFFGETALIQDVKRTASVIAVVLCELLVLSKPDFHDLIGKHETLRAIFMDVVFARHAEVLKASSLLHAPPGTEDDESTALVGEVPNHGVSEDAEDSSSDDAAPPDAEDDDGDVPPEPEDVEGSSPLAPIGDDAEPVEEDVPFDNPFASLIFEPSSHDVRGTVKTTHRGRR